MVQFFSKKDFKIQPWKNGGGTTTELFRYSTNNNDDFKFRISSAKVEKDGPFSLYENIDRVLILLKGKGFSLSSSNYEKELSGELAIFSFAGEDKINCKLIDGECLDFNVMADRRFAHALVSIEKGATFSWHAIDSKIFIYLISREELILIEKGENYQLNTSELINVIVIRLNITI